jgi:hypothetical protein
MLCQVISNSLYYEDRDGMVKSFFVTLTAGFS